MKDASTPNPRRPGDRLPLTRRVFLRRTGISVLGLAIGIQAAPEIARAASAKSSKPLLDLLQSSPFVYISPLRKNGQESRCHAEVWFAWIDESIVITVAADRWKATALERGLTGARIWVGDHGRWKTPVGGRKEAFRQAPSFSARAEKVEDPKMIDRLLDVYAEKYPGEIDRWRDRMKAGNADGSRIMIRYRPDATS